MEETDVGDVAGGTGVVVLPEADPVVLIGVVDFILHRYDDLVSTARREGFEPMLTLPAELVDARGRLLDELVRQSREAIAAGNTSVRARLPVGEDLIEVIRWYWVRSNLFASISMEGMPEQWHAAIGLFRVFLHSIAGQLPADRLRL